MATGICMSVVSAHEVVEYEERNLLVLKLPLSGIADGGHVVRLYSQAVTPLVRSYVVCRQSEVWSKRPWGAAGPGVGQLSYGVELVA